MENNFNLKQFTRLLYSTGTMTEALEDELASIYLLRANLNYLKYGHLQNMVMK